MKRRRCWTQKRKRDILAMVKALNRHKGVTVIAITHDLSEVVSSDRVIVMNRGEVFLEERLKRFLRKVKR